MVVLRDFRALAPREPTAFSGPDSGKPPKLPEEMLEVVAFLEGVLAGDPLLYPADLARKLRERFGLSVRPGASSGPSGGSEKGGLRRRGERADEAGGVGEPLRGDAGIRGGGSQAARSARPCPARAARVSRVVSARPCPGNRASGR